MKKHYRTTIDVYVYFKGKHGYEKIGEKTGVSPDGLEEYMRKYIGKHVTKADRVTRSYSKLLGHGEEVYFGAIKFEVGYRDHWGARL
jgi:hypothetical protein